MTTPPLGALLEAAIAAAVETAVEKTIARLLPHLAGAADDFVAVDVAAPELGVTTRKLKEDLTSRNVEIKMVGRKWFVRRTDLVGAAAPKLAKASAKASAANDSTDADDDGHAEDRAALRAAARRVSR